MKKKKSAADVSKVISETVDATNVKAAAEAADETLTGTAADVDEIMKKYDRESNTRPWKGIPSYVIKAALALFSLFMIYMNLFAVWDERIRRSLFLGMVVIFVFVLFPARKNSRKPQKVNRIPWYDVVLALAGAFSFFYFVANNKAIISHATHITTLEIWLGVIGILILAECCRRVTGIPILVVAGCFVIYAFYVNIIDGKSFYKILRKVVYNLFYTTTGVIGTPIGVCSTYIVLFIIFGAFLETTGIADFFIQCANTLAGSASGGPAKVAVISSALCGMVSGSSVGNTVTTGSVTIPMMKSTGYPGEFAGAVEAAASTGGQIMPPIMGAAAFLMAEMVGVPYSNIVVRAILPAVLYFTGIFLMVHLRAKRLGLKGIPREQLPKLKTILPNVYLLIPLFVLVVLIVSGFTMSRSAIIATLLCIMVSVTRIYLVIPLGIIVGLLVTGFPVKPLTCGIALLCIAASLVNIKRFVTVGSIWREYKAQKSGESTFKRFAAAAEKAKGNKPGEQNYMTPKRFVDALETGAKNTLSIAVACGIAGIIAGVVTMTGLGQVFISAIVSISHGNLMIALVLTMLCCIVLGMGVPTTATYIIMATTCAPILTTGMGLNSLCASMFVFYFGIVADITPPVALAAYAGSAIAKSDPMRTALNASKLAIAAFLIPYMFCLNPAMLLIDTNPGEFLVIIITSVIGMYAIAAGLEGYMMTKLNPLFRVILVAAGLCLIYPGTLTDIIGTAVTAVIFVIELGMKKKAVQA